MRLHGPASGTVKIGLRAILSLLLTLSVTNAEPINPGSIVVGDGDTIKARGENYRLVGFDAPEMWNPHRRVSIAEQNLGWKAKQRLKELIASGPVDLEEVPCACTIDAKRDKAGRCRTANRLCAILTVNGKDVAETLITEGLAYAFVCTPTECPKRLPWPK